MMKYVFILSMICCMEGGLFAQVIYTIPADSTKLTGCDSNELIIENHTQAVKGFLYNKGNGRTEFRRALVQVDDTTYLVGGDTLRLEAGLWKRNGNHIYNINSGNVGIRRTAPNVLLDLPGPVNIDDTSSYRINYHPMLRVGDLEGGSYTNFYAGDSSGLNDLQTNGTFIGSGSGVNNGGPYNAVIGFNAGHDNMGGWNSFVGCYSGENNSDGGTAYTSSENSFFGWGSGRYSSGGENTFIGVAAGSGQSGDENTAIGYAAAGGNAGTQNLFMGSYTGQASTGNLNCLLGYYAAQFSVGSGNAMMGANSGVYNNGSNCVFLGQGAGHQSAGDDNVFIGGNAGYLSYTYETPNNPGNTFVGTQAGQTCYKCSYNTFLGVQAGALSRASNGVTLLGSYATAALTDDLHNSTALGNSAVVNTSNTMVFGNNAVNAWMFNSAATMPSGGVLVVGNNSTNGNGAYLTTGGVWTNASDRSKKEHFETLNSEDLLEKIAALPVTRWNYKGLTEQHIGPVAQDFYRIFHVGADDKSISTIDPSGIALAGVQGLYQKYRESERRAEEQQSIISGQQSQITDLQARIKVQEAQAAEQAAQMNRLLEKFQRLETVLEKGRSTVGNEEGYTKK